MDKLKLITVDIPLYPNEGFRGTGPLGLVDKNTSDAGDIFNDVISKIIGIMTVIGIIWFVILLITGALGIMTAGGDKAKVESAQKRITTGLIGLVILVAGVFILDFIGKLLGIESILNPGEFIKSFTIGG